MFCTNCGKKIEDGATVCPECGAPLLTEAADSKKEAKTARTDKANAANANNMITATPCMYKDNKAESVSGGGANASGTQPAGSGKDGNTGKSGKSGKSGKPGKEKMGLGKRLLRINWLGVIGLGLYVGSVCTGTWYFVLTVIALVVCAVAVARRRKHTFNWIAVIGLALSCLATSVIAFAILVVVLCVSFFRSRSVRHF